MNNNDEIYLNDVGMEKEIMKKEFEIQPSLQTKKYINADEEKEKNGGNFFKSKKKVETR